MDRLVDQLWGEQPPKTAATSLQNLVSQLRKLLGPDCARDATSRLRAADRRRERSTWAGSSVWSPRAGLPKPAERAATLREALALWRGAPLADLAFETFAQNEIRRLEELRLEAIEERIDADLELGEGSSLVPELEALVSQLPLRERLRAQLMLALYRSGRQAEALDVYHAGRGALSEQLGIDPGPELQQLYGRILRQESVLAPGSLDGRSRRRSLRRGREGIAGRAARARARHGGELRRRHPRSRRDRGVPCRLLRLSAGRSRACPGLRVRRAHEGCRPALRRASRPARPGLRPRAGAAFPRGCGQAAS